MVRANSSPRITTNTLQRQRQRRTPMHLQRLQRQHPNPQLRSLRRPVRHRHRRRRRQRQRQRRPRGTDALQLHRAELLQLRQRQLGRFVHRLVCFCCDDRQQRRGHEDFGHQRCDVDPCSVAGEPGCCAGCYCCGWDGVGCSRVCAWDALSDGLGLELSGACVIAVESFRRPESNCFEHTPYDCVNDSLKCT